MARCGALGTAHLAQRVLEPLQLRDRERLEHLGRCRGDVGEMQGRCGGDVVEIWGRYRGDGGSRGLEHLDAAQRLGELLRGGVPGHLVEDGAVQAPQLARGRAHHRGRARLGVEQRELAWGEIGEM